MPSSDSIHYDFLTTPAANLQVRLGVNQRGGTELHLHGNRAGTLSLANILLWLLANSWRREFLSLHELPFVHLEGALSLCLRVTDEQGNGFDGSVKATDQGEQFEWSIPEDDLRRLGLAVHSLACRPHHEYDRLNIAPGSDACIEVRMTDAREWFAGPR